MVWLAATAIGRSRVANLDAGAYIAGTRERSKKVILHLALLTVGGSLAIIDAVEVAAGTLVVVAESTGAVNTHDGIHPIILAPSALGTSVARVGSTGAIGRNI